MTNSADPDQLAEEANWSGSTLFAKKGHVVLSKRRVKHPIIISAVRFKMVLLFEFFCFCLPVNPL